MSNRGITRRTLNSGAGALALSGLYAGLSEPSRGAELTPFKIGISAIDVTILVVYFAVDGGFCEKYGLKPAVIDAEGGTRGIQVLLSGEIQAMHVGLAPVIQANSQGADLRLVTASSNLMPFVFYGKKGQKPALTKGCTIGISTFGSETDVAVTIALQKFGLTRDDVTISQIGGNSQRIVALVAGRVDAAPLLEPGITLAKQKGLVEILDLTAANTPWIFDAVVVMRSYAQSNPDTLTQFLKAYVEGAMRGLGDPAWAKEVIAKRFKTKDPNVIDATYESYRRLMPRDAVPSAAAAKAEIAQLKAAKLPVGSDNPSAYLDPSFVEKLKSSGFTAAMQKQYGVSPESSHG